MDNFLYLPRALASTLFDLAFAGAFGSLFALLWLGLAADLRRPERRVLTLCAAAMLLALPLQWWLLTATMVGSAAAADIRPMLWDVLTGTHPGRVLLPDFLCATLLLAASIPRRRGSTRAALALAFLLAAFRSASGHAASNGNFSRGEIVQFLHLTSIAIWAGAVIMAGLLVVPHLPSAEAATKFGQRLSRTVTLAIVVVGLSGIYNAWIGLDGSLQPLPRTQWGILLLIKTALVLTALALGGANRLTLARNPALTPADALRFTRTLRVEAFVMVAILILSGFLANSPPATGI